MSRQDMDNFKDIPGWENEYAVSRDGKIYSYKSLKILTPHPDRDGYLRVHLKNDFKEIQMSIHRAVALTYIPNPNDLSTVDHINRVRNDNRVENLRWATRSEQNYNSKRETYVNREHPVECRDKLDHSKLIASFDNCCQAAIEMLGDRSKNSLINRCAQGKKPSAYGYWWCFK